MAPPIITDVQGFGKSWKIGVHCFFHSSTFSGKILVGAPVITKDFGSFHMRMAQQGNKALQSVESNAILGEWIRKKIGAPSGGYITKQMLELYGKTYVTFRKYEDGTYLLDF